MDLRQVSQGRQLLGKIGAALCILLFLAVLDGLVALFRQPPNLLKVLPGESVEINGDVPGEISQVQELQHRANTGGLTLAILELHKGYFLGGAMWRGQLKVSPNLAPGEYRVIVFATNQPRKQPAPFFRVLVYADAQARLRSSSSLIQRYTGYSPWMAAASFAPFILLVFGLVFYLSQQRENLLLAQGRGEIYRLMRDEAGWSIRFGLGAAQGLSPGTRLTILDEEGRTVGVAEVRETGETDSWAVVSGDPEVKIGYLVAIR